MPEPTRQKHRPKMNREHLIHVSLQQAKLDQFLQVDAIRQPLHVVEKNAWAKLGNHGSVAFEHSFVNASLQFGKLAIDGKRHGNIRRITAVLTAHVKETHVSIVDALVVRGTSVPVMQGGSIVARTADASVRHETHATMKVRVMLEDAFELIFVHSRASLSHDLFVSVTANFVGVTHELDFSSRLDDTALSNLRVQHGFVRVHCLDAFKLCRQRVQPTVRIKPFHDQELWVTRYKRWQHLRNLVGEKYFINAVQRLEILWRLDRAHPDAILVRQARYEQDRLARRHHNAGVAIRLENTKRPEKVRLLAKKRLVITVIAESRLASLEKCNGVLQSWGVVCLGTAPCTQPLHKAQPVVTEHSVRHWVCAGGHLEHPCHVTDVMLLGCCCACCRCCHGAVIVCASVTKS
eukprot:m.77042 g.77042  ORF g.77042 m.77042 type:complete len:406 (+) comp14534_c0_seq4:389-1606(+)